MSWRWISITALLGTLVIGYAALTGRSSFDVISSGTPAQPGYHLRDAVITQTREDGSPELRLIAERIEQNNQHAGIEMQTVQVDYLNAPERRWKLTARHGFVPPDSRIVQFSGDVQLNPADQPDDTYLRTEALEIDTMRNIAYSTQSPVQMQLHNNRLTVKRFEADLTTEAVQLEAARGRIIPR